jgi:hypothetical protein
MLALGVVLLAGLLPAAGAQAAKPKLSVGNQSVDESDGHVEFIVVLSKRAKRTVSVDYETTDGSAIAPDDYTETDGTAKIKRKKRKATLAVPVTEDADPEEEESFSVTLSHPRRASIKDGEALAFIRGNDGCEGGADSDADGHPDCLDPCPNDSNPANVPCPATIYAINDGTFPSGTDVAVTDSMVTAVSGTSAWIGVQPSDPEFDGFNHSGIEVDLSGISSPPTLNVGDRVNVEGAATPDLLTADDIAITGTGGTPVADEVDLGDFEGQPTALDAVLTKLSYLNAGAPDEDGNWPLQGLSVLIGKGIMGTLPAQGFGPGDPYVPQPPLRSVTGIAEMSGDASVVLPRTLDDILPDLYTVVSQPCITVAGGGFLFVTLSGVAHTNTVVSVVSNHPEIATTDPSAMIAQGQRVASLPLTMQGGTGTASFTATLENRQDTREFQVKNSCP